MNQPSQPDQEPKGLTAVLDGLIQESNEKERATENPPTQRPLAGKTRSSSQLMSESELLDLRRQAIAESAAAATQAVNPTPKPTPAPQGGDTRPAVMPNRMPPMPSQVSLTAHAALGRTRWSTDAIRKLGLPDTLIDGTTSLPENDDAQWLSALVKLVAPLCRGIEDTPTMIVSRGSSELAEALGLDVHQVGTLPPYGGTIFCANDGSELGQEWLRRVRGDRKLHLLIESRDPESDIAIGEPSAVSYASRDGAIGAIRAAVSTGATIAFGVSIDGNPIRANGLDLALALRSMVGS